MYDDLHRIARTMLTCIVSVEGGWTHRLDARGERVSPRENVRSNMVEGAVRLLASQGVEGTSFK